LVLAVAHKALYEASTARISPRSVKHSATEHFSVPAYNRDEMNRRVEAVYENGVLRPLEPLPLREHQKVRVTVSDTEDPLASMIDYAFVESARREIQLADHVPSLEEVRGILSRIPGSLAADIGDQREERFSEISRCCPGCGAAGCGS